MIISKSIKYYQDKARIDKSINQDTAYKIQFYNNRVIDNYIKEYNKGNVNNRPATAMLWADLNILNKPAVYNNYNRIINSPYTSNDKIFELIVKNKANKNLNNIIEAELDRISKNLDYVEQVVKNYEIPYTEYEKLVNEQKNRSIANRQEILKKVAEQANELLVKEGLNIPSAYSYRNPALTAEAMLRQTQMATEHKKTIAINEQSINDGKNAPYTMKKWIWTGAGKTTRHQSSHLQERPIDETFTIINDETLEIDELMYPSDPAGSYGNSFICYCEVEYGDGDFTYKNGGDEHSVNQTVYEPRVKFGKHLTS